ncbi:MAG: hypothetical protein PHV49_05505 [Alistipes sp.]|nr:hypothetical protein [Alistipes sp.]
MKQIKTLLATLCIALVAASCNDEREGDTPAANPDVAQLIQIGAFPAFDQGETRVIGTEDAGKTAWAAGDEVLLRITTNAVNAPLCYTLTYNGTTWTSLPEGSVFKPTWDATTLSKIEAFYAPSYTWVPNPNTGRIELGLKNSDVAAGDQEFIMREYDNVALTDDNTSLTLTIDFSGARTYSRLRVAAEPNVTRTLTCTTFQPAGSTEAVTVAISATTDAKGNAYFYGSWPEGTTINILNESNETLVSKTGLTANTANTSYVLDAAAIRVDASTHTLTPRKAGLVTNERITNALGEGTVLNIAGKLFDEDLATIAAYTAHSITRLNVQGADMSAVTASTVDLLALSSLEYLIGTEAQSTKLTTVFTLPTGTHLLYPGAAYNGFATPKGELTLDCYVLSTSETGFKILYFDPNAQKTWPEADAYCTNLGGRLIASWGEGFRDSPTLQQITFDKQTGSVYARFIWTSYLHATGWHKTLWYNEETPKWQQGGGSLDTSEFLYFVVFDLTF